MGMMLRRNRTSSVKNMDAPVQEIELATPVVEEVLEEKKTFEVPVIDEVVDKAETENKVIFPYTKTDVIRMSTAELKKIAKKFGIDHSLTGTEIKKQIIAKFEL